MGNRVIIGRETKNRNMDTVGPIKREFMIRAMRAVKACDSQDAFVDAKVERECLKDAVGKLFREALDAIGYLEQRQMGHDEFICDVRIMTTAMQNLLGVEEGKREKVEQEDGVAMILTESETKARFVDTCVAVMKRAENAKPNVSNAVRSGDTLE